MRLTLRNRRDRLAPVTMLALAGLLVSGAAGWLHVDGVLAGGAGSASAGPRLVEAPAAGQAHGTDYCAVCSWLRTLRTGTTTTAFTVPEADAPGVTLQSACLLQGRILVANLPARAPPL